MFRRTLSAAYAAMIILFGASPLAGQSDSDSPPGEPLHTATYVETTAGSRIELTAREWSVPGGLHLESVSSAGDRHVVLVDSALGTRSWLYVSEREATAVQTRRDGERVVIDGRVGDAPVRGEVELPEPLWIQSIERSLRRFVLEGSPGDRLRFAVVQPDNLSARTLQARIMGDEEITVSGERVLARRIRISLPGIGVVIWRSNYWFRLPDGLFVQSRVTRGPPGTPETVVSLVSDSGPAPE
jgi:hypothetical protein